MKVFAKGHRLEASGWLLMMCFYIVAAGVFYLEIMKELRLMEILTAVILFIASFCFTQKQGRRMFYADLALLPLVPFFIMFAMTDRLYLLEYFVIFCLCGNLGIASSDCLRRMRGITE